MIKQQLGFMQDKPNKDFIYATPRAFEFTYYLSDCVQDSHEYHELMQCLDNASENDLVRIVINNEGGEVGTTVQLVAHIRNSNATVVGVLTGNAFSAAGILLLACHSQEIAEHSMLMIHGAVGGAMGKYSDMANYITAANKRTRVLYEDIFEGFLSKEELDNVFKGEEMWLTFPEIIGRLQKRDAHFKSLAEEAHKQAEQQFNEMMGEDDIPEFVYKKLSKTDLISLCKGLTFIDEIDEEAKTFKIVDVSELENITQQD